VITSIFRQKTKFAKLSDKTANTSKSTDYNHQTPLQHKNIPATDETSSKIIEYLTHTSTTDAFIL